MGKRSFTCASAPSDENEAVPKRFFFKTSNTANSLLPHYNGGIAVPASTVRNAMSLPGLVTPLPSVPGPGPFSGTQQTLIQEALGNEQRAPLCAAEVIALGGQLKVAAQSAEAVYSGAQPVQQNEQYPTENRWKRQLFSLQDSPEPFDPLQDQSALRGADTKASVLIVASGSEESRGMLVRTVGKMHGRYTNEDVAAMQNHSNNSFAATQHQQLHFFTGELQKAHATMLTIAERHGDQLAATEERNHKWHVSEREKERAACAAMQEHSLNHLASENAKDRSALLTILERSSNDRAASEMRNSNNMAAMQERSNQMVEGIMGKLIAAMSPNVRHTAAVDEQSLDSDTEMLDS
jgi:hypothetical protein